jgi:hypothetical protein
MKKIAESSWEYTVYEHEGRIFLEVLCGTVGMYEVAIELNAEERAEWESKGAAGILPLVEQVRYDSLSFDRRKVELPPLDTAP